MQIKSLKCRLIYILLLASIFFFRCGFQEKIEPSWRKYLIWTAGWGGEHNAPDTQNTQNTLIIFSSAFAGIQVIFWTEDSFCFTSDSRNSFNCKLKKLINEQIINFYNPSNALSSSHQSVEIKFFFKYHTFIGRCSLSSWFNLQILNFC